MMSFIGLTITCSSDVFADKRHITPRLSLVNVRGLNKVLRSEIFISEDGQLRAVHLILDFKPLSNIFQDFGQAIKVRDPRLRWLNFLSPVLFLKQQPQGKKLRPPACP